VLVAVGGYPLEFTGLGVVPCAAKKRTQFGALMQLQGAVGTATPSDLRYVWWWYAPLRRLLERIRELNEPRLAAGYPGKTNSVR
jgi:hypothetical protein